MEKKTRKRATQPCTNPDCKRIRENLQEEIRRLKSASYDLMKQTGDWQCGGRTHRDHSDAFDSLFLREADNLSQEIHTKTGMDETSARVLLCQLFQKVYNRCRGRVLDHMRTTLSTVGSVGQGRNVREAEALHDTCRAYGLLLHSSQLRQVPAHKEISTQVHNELMRVQHSLSAAESELEKFTKSVAEMSWGLLTTVPPLICAQPSNYSFSRHDQEHWDTGRDGNKLVYFRPVLFSSYEGRVAMKGWVTNRETGRPINLLDGESGDKDVLSSGHSRCDEEIDEAVASGMSDDYLSTDLSSVQSVLADLSTSQFEEVREEEREGGRGEGTREEGDMAFETLSLFRLTNK